MQDTADCLGVGEHAGNLTHGAVVVDSREFTGIEESIPVSHVDNEVIILRTGVIEFREGAAGVQVMVILVDLAQSVANLEVSLEVIHPVFLGAVDWYTAVGALEVRMSRGQVCNIGGFSGFGVVRRDGRAGLLVAWVGAEGILFDELSAFANCRRGRVREGVEQVVRFQDGPRVEPSFDGGGCRVSCPLRDGRRRGLGSTAGLAVGMLGLLLGVAQRSTVALRAKAADERRGDGASSPRGGEALQASLRS